MSVRSVAMRQKRAGLADQAQTLLAKEGGMTTEDRQKFDAIMLDVDTLKGDIDREERQEALDLELRSTTRPPEANPNPNPGSAAASVDEKRAAVREYRNNLRRFGSAGVDRMAADKRQICEDINSRWWEAFRNQLAARDNVISAEDRAVLAGESPEFRDMGVATGAAGLYTVPQGFVYNVDTAMKFYGSMLESSDIMDTANGASLPWPTQNDTTQTGEQVDENTQTNKQDLTFGRIVFGAFKYSTKMIPISIELLQDSAFNLEGYVQEQFAIRLGRILNTKFTTGGGTTEPNGIITAATSGVAAAIGSSTNDGGSGTGANSIGTTDLTELEHSVDRSYRRGAAWMMHASTEKFRKELLDKYGRPIWRASLSSGAPDMINGYPYYVNNDMATIGASNKTVLFGQLKKYKIRRVKELSVVKLVERFADYGQIALLGFARYDGNLLDAGTHPVKYLVQHS